jgi:hypothetical protein
MPDQGATFVVYLPAADSENEIAPEPGTPDV